MLQTVFNELYDARVRLEGMVLKPNMVIDGKAARKASREEVAEKTLRVLKATVPAAVPGIAFLSGGQSDEEATAPSVAHERGRPFAVEAHLLLWPRAAGRGAEGMGRQAARMSLPASAPSPIAPG